MAKKKLRLFLSFGRASSHDVRLFGRQIGFWNGFGSILDIGGTMGITWRHSARPTETDARALRRDWQAVGRDLTNGAAQSSWAE